MSKSLKKILVTGASLLMFASVGAGINSNDNSASANVALTSESQYRKIRGARVIATRPHGSRRPFGDNTTLGYVNGNSVIVNGNGEVTRIDGRRATRSLFDRVFNSYRSHRRRAYRHHLTAYQTRELERNNRELNKIDEQSINLYNEYLRQMTYVKYYKKMSRQIHIPNQLSGAWQRKRRTEIVFKPFTHRTMTKLINHASDKRNRNIINNYFNYTNNEHIRPIGHNQYIIENSHDKIGKFILRYKITVLNHNEIKLSRYGKKGVAPAPSGIYKRDNFVKISYTDDMPYGITYAKRKGNNLNLY